MPRIAYEQGGSAQTALSTPGAASTVLSASEYEVPEGAVAVVRWHVMALNAAGSAGATFVVEQSARRPAGGGAALVDSADVKAKRDAALALTGVAVEASGTKVRLKAIGLAATALSWWVSYEAEVGGAPLPERKKAMSEESPYNPGAMRLLMSAALGVDYEATEGDELEVSCPAQGVAAPCSEAGADQLVGLANARMTTVDQTYNAALEARDRSFGEVQRAQGIAEQMRQSSQASAGAPPQEG